MTTKNNIPAGYKDSAVGIIPQEWEVATLGKLVSITSGESPSLFNLRDIGKYPYIKVEDMNNCEKYQANSREYTDDERVVIAKGSIIFPKRGAAITNNKVRIVACPVYMDSNMMAITPNDLVCGDYLYFKITYEQLFKIADTSTIPQINNKHIIPYKICLPPMAEQRKIAEILGAWDEAIEKQSRLIEKLELRKRGLMQRLLTGRTRLPGFTTPWQKVKLGEICNEITLRNTEENDFIVLSCTKYDGLVSSLEYFGKQIFSNDLSNYKIVPKNYFAYATNHIEEGSIGYQKDYDYALISPMYTVFSTDKNKVDNYFMYTLLKTPMMIYNYQSRIEGSIDRRGGLRYDTFAGINIQLPSLPEQKAIAEVLTTADNEIATHRKKLDVLRLQKRGLMQQLLTGKTRVKI